MSEKILMPPSVAWQQCNLSLADVVNSIEQALPVRVEDLKREGVFIFGIGKLGRRVCSFLTRFGVTVRGFIDNNSAEEGKKLNGFEIFSPSSIPSDSIVYIASVTYCSVMTRQLVQGRQGRFISHLQAGIMFRGVEAFPTEMYQKHMVEDLVENQDCYREVFSFLDDDESRRVFDGLVQFRLTLNQEYIEKVRTDSSIEYIDPEVIQFSDEELYFDIGGFDGDSAERFLSHVGGRYRGVHIFEPDLMLLAKAQERLRGQRDIVFCPIGIFSREGVLRFDITGGLDGIISDCGSVEIKVTAIDCYLGATPSFIKFDVEGVELEAIDGARKTISEVKPRLAVASYHYPQHLHQIPKKVLGFNSDYKIRLRHYSDFVFDSIYYFI